MQRQNVTVPLKNYDWNATKDIVSTIGHTDRKMVKFAFTIPLTLMGNIKIFPFTLHKTIHACNQVP